MKQSMLYKQNHLKNQVSKKLQLTDMILKFNIYFLLQNVPRMI